MPPADPDNVDNFEFGVIQDSLAQSLGTAIPNRALVLVCGGIGTGKSIIGQRMSFGMTANDIRVSLVTTELTTRGWLEQVSSIGYFMEKRIDNGEFHLMSSFGVIADKAEEPVDLLGLLDSPALKEAEVIIIDRASQMIPADTEGPALLSSLRQYTAQGRALFLMIDPEEMDPRLLRELKASAEVVLDMMTSVVGGQLVRTLCVTRFLRAAGPVTERIGWKVMPEMGFIVDITAVA
ncbi:MAG: ATPase domain-containing protein [Candidatus Thalassarchaeaceae archaeon]|nr:ATPase domain-containing protein [Candidatus Thalassarchaeaceae archaeon]MDP7091222.1 ATPase domain-containing protein [Candidatus Thalassarchaeaceae archaeon]MDP7445712.1 ATPase domain-containing protein [Candidatus Thalassarchaeaceae archaeon]